jgi:hypothetical protein
VPNRAIDGLLVGAIALVLLVPLGQRVIARRFDPFEPFFLFVLAYGVMFVVRPAAMIAGDSLVFVGPARTLDVSSHFTEMLVIALLGALGFSVGYALPLGKRIASRRADNIGAVDDRRLIMLVLVFTALGMFAFAAFAASTDGFRTVAEIFHADKSALSGGEGSYRYLWLAFFVLIPAALALYGLGMETRRRAIVVCSIVVSLIVLLRAIPLGNRIVLLPLIGGLVVFRYLQRRHRPSGRSLALLALIALFLSPFLSDLRGRGTRGESVVDTFVRASKPSRLVQPFTSGPDSEMAPALAAALSVIPDRLPHEYGRVIFGDLVLRPIPRPFWSHKPLIPRERLIATLWPVEAARGTINPEFSVLLYFYWDFGTIGVLLGMAMFGVGARYLYDLYRLREDRLSVRVVYALSVWFVVIALRDSPVDTLVWAAFVILPAWLIFRGARAPVRAASPAAISVEPRASA